MVVVAVGVRLGTQVQKDGLQRGQAVVGEHAFGTVRRQHLPVSHQANLVGVPGLLDVVRGDEHRQLLLLA